MRCVILYLHICMHTHIFIYAYIYDTYASFWSLDAFIYFLICASGFFYWIIDMPHGWFQHKDTWIQRLRFKYVGRRRTEIDSNVLAQLLWANGWHYLGGRLSRSVETGGVSATTQRSSVARGTLLYIHVCLYVCICTFV